MKLFKLWYGKHSIVAPILLSVTVIIFLVNGTFCNDLNALAVAAPKDNIINIASEKQLLTGTGAHLPKIGYNSTDNGTLTFDEEFNEASLDTSLWNIEDYSTDHYQNCCMKFGSQYFTAQDIALKQGVGLRITSENRSLGGYQYTSGAVTTENKFSFLYGRVDISARIPRGQGMWPALWMLSGNHDHEINIMEMANDSTIAYQTFHMNVPTYNSYIFQCISRGQDLSAAFHVYSLIWSPNSLSWYIDGQPTCQITQYIPQTPMYLLLDTAIGGVWPGLPNAHTAFPQYTDVAYVRVYQAAPSIACVGLQVSSPLQVSPTITRGKTINATVTYKNVCNTSITLNNVIIAGRTPAGGNADFGNKSGPVTLLPGQSVTVTASRVIRSSDPTGQWDAFSSFQTPDGVWHADGTNLLYFTVT